MHKIWITCVLTYIQWWRFVIIILSLFHNPTSNIYKFLEIHNSRFLIFFCFVFSSKWKTFFWCNLWFWSWLLLFIFLLNYCVIVWIFCMICYNFIHIAIFFHLFFMMGSTLLIVFIAINLIRHFLEQVLSLSAFFHIKLVSMVNQKFDIGLIFLKTPSFNFFFFLIDSVLTLITIFFGHIFQFLLTSYPSPFWHFI